MNTRVFVITCLSVVVLACSPKVDFETWDIDNNGKIEKREYMQVSNVFGKWDANRDNRISRDEAQETVYLLIDANEDNAINENEWRRAILLIPGNSNTGDSELFDTWDINKDEIVDSDELSRNMEKIFDPWDRNNDSFLSKDEFYEITFMLWDADNNGHISRNEFNMMTEFLKENKTLWERLF